MRQLLLILIFLPIFKFTALASNINITVGEGGLVYSPDAVTVNVGDNVIFNGNLGFHPTVQVDQITWTTNGSTPMPGGFSFTSGTTATLTITPGMSGTTIYYVCVPHVPGGMKGKITVNVIASVSDNRTKDFNFTVFPNPVNNNSSINISTKKSSRTTITLFDMNGRQIRQLVDLFLQQGEITLPLNTGTLQKGSYILLMRTAEGTLKKQILIQ